MVYHDLSTSSRQRSFQKEDEGNALEKRSFLRRYGKSVHTSVHIVVGNFLLLCEQVILVIFTPRGRDLTYDFARII